MSGAPGLILAPLMPLAHGALGAWDEAIAVGLVVAILGGMALYIRWQDRRAEPLEPPPPEGDQ